MLQHNINNMLMPKQEEDQMLKKKEFIMEQMSIDTL